MKIANRGSESPNCMQIPTLQISLVEAGIRADELSNFTFPCN